MSSSLGGRYVPEEVIGRGGMAVVYRALDTHTQRRVALKQLSRRNEEEGPHSRELFEREFHTLVRLAHPRIVEALDYGLDGDVPFYTMELLDGGDLVERAPLAWRTACAVARDVCSALSLVHSRRMVFRDLSPRNVRCTADGKAKLIDFGAMVVMGAGQIAVCTPAVAAPEVVQRGLLDGRSDLYALGATLYRTLVGRSPYPARDFHQLDELWKHRPQAPSELVPDIPKALDVLVLDMLQLDPELRPTSAAEVFQRLSAIAELEADEDLRVSRSYLTTPTLVGRDTEVRRVRKAVQRLLEHRVGSALMVLGPHGAGRSRFLDDAAIHAKVSGLAVVRTGAAQASNAPLGVARELVSQLLQSLPEGESRRAAPEEQSGQAELRDFLVNAARSKPLLLAIDDIEQMDADSRALVALLARESDKHPFLLLVSRDREAPVDSDAERVLYDACSSVTLPELDFEQTQALFASIFGDVPNLSGLVWTMNRLTSGNPQGLMRLAQHLIDRSIIRHQDGSWVLPEQIDGAELPASMSEAFRATIYGLDANARALARALAKCPEQRFDTDECLSLTAHGDRRLLFDSLDVLQTKGIVVAGAGGYRLSGGGWIEPLGGSSDAAVELALARVFQRRGDGLRAARHLFVLGRETEGVDVLVKYAEELHRETSTNPRAYATLFATLPRDWLKIFTTGIALCEKHGRPARDTLAIQNPLSGILAQSDVCSDGQQAALARRLGRDAGLDLYDAQEPQTPPMQRLQTALVGASQRYAATPEHDRLLDPQASIGQLVRTVISAIGSFSRTLELSEWRRLPSLAPLAPLSPAVAVVEQLARGFDARLSARYEEARSIYQQTLSRLENPQGTGLDPTFADAVRAGVLGMLGMLEAALGLESSEARAAQVAEHGLYRGSALTIRMLAKLWQGDTRAADRLAREREMQLLEQPRREAGDALVLLWCGRSRPTPPPTISLARAGVSRPSIGSRVKCEPGVRLRTGHAVSTNAFAVTVQRRCTRSLPPLMRWKRGGTRFGRWLPRRA